MRRKIVGLFLGICLVAFPKNAYAEQFVPPIPSWWPSGGFDLRHGAWLPCNGGIWATHDCIESIEIRRKTESEWKSLLLVPNPRFKAESEKQITPNSLDANDYAYFYEQYGYWTAPKGYETNDKGLGIFTDLGVFGSYRQPAIGIQAWMSLAMRTQDRSVPLDTNYVYRIKIKSEFLKSYVRSIVIPSKQTTFDWSTPGYLSVTATPSTFYYPKDDWDEMCRGTIKDTKPEIENQEINFVINFWDNEKDKHSPSQLIVASNGSQCFYGLNFDATSGTLKVGVGTVQYDMKGEPIRGWLETQIERELLMRWWNIDPAVTAGVAQVQVTNSDGTTSIISTTSSYDKTNNRLQILSNGFSFPLPEISIRIVAQKSGDQPTTPSTIKPTQTKKLTITCTKGKLVKKVTAVNPKCPTGYKKVKG